MRQRTFIKAPQGSGLKDIHGDWTPGVWSLMQVRRDPFAFGARRRAKFGNVGAMRLLGANMVMAIGAEAAELVTVNRDKAFANGPGWNLIIGHFFNRGLMLLDFDEHRQHRHIMQEAFTPNALRNYFTRLDGLAAAAAADFPTGTVPMQPAFKNLSLRLAVDSFVAVEISDTEYRDLAAAFTDTVRAGTTLLRVKVPGGRYARGFTGRRHLEQFFRSHLPAKRATETNDLFSVLCHATADGQRFTDDDIVNHMIFLLMAAHDTTTIALTQFAYRLAQHPAWQDKVVAEIASLPDNISYDDLDQLPAMDMVLRESLRMCPPVPAYPRMTVKDTEILGHYVPKGTRVTVPALNNHLNPDWWTNPMTFDPERFSEERRGEITHRFAWSPFGGGAHKCLGMYFAMREIKLIFVHLLRQYSMAVPAGYEAPMDYSALPTPKDQLPVTVTLRRRPRPSGPHSIVAS